MMIVEVFNLMNKVQPEGIPSPQRIQFMEFKIL